MCQRGKRGFPAQQILTLSIERTFDLSSNYWIELTDEVDEGVWRWVNGDPFDYANGWSGMPDNQEVCDPAGEDYAHIWAADGAGKWNDASTLPSDPTRDDRQPLRAIVEVPPRSCSSGLIPAGLVHWLKLDGNVRDCWSSAQLGATTMRFVEGYDGQGLKTCGCQGPRVQTDLRVDGSWTWAGWLKWNGFNESHPQYAYAFASRSMDHRIRLYLNGELASELFSRRPRVSLARAIMTLGNGRNNQHFNGAIDEVLLFDAELEAGEIQRIHRLPETAVITVEGTGDVGEQWGTLSRQVIEKPKGGERFFRVRMD